VSSEVLNPIDFAEAWDIATCAGVDSPGVIPPGGISGAKRTYKYDVKTGKGTAGSTTTFVGKPPSPFTIKFEAWTPAHFSAWGSFLPLFKYNTVSKVGQAFDIFHPSLADLDIKSVVVTDIGQWVSEGGGLWSRTIEFLEYFPASKKSIVSTPTGSKSTAPTYVGGAPPGNTQDSQIAALQNQAASLTKQAQGAAT
jgi:hypothetical protein